MNIKTRKQAVKDGDKVYFSGKPCKKGHLAPRLVAGVCLMCKQEYNEVYNETHKEHIKEYHKKRHTEKYSTENRRKKYRENVELELFHHAKHRALKKGLEFTINKEDIVTPNFCPVFGIPINFDNKHNVPTLDRIDSSKGYIKENVQVISSKANRLKNNGTIEEFKKIIFYMERFKK